MVLHFHAKVFSIQIFQYLHQIPLGVCALLCFSFQLVITSSCSHKWPAVVHSDWIANTVYSEYIADATSHLSSDPFRIFDGGVCQAT